MSKCWYCNNELTSGDSPKHFGICNKCYDEMFKSSDTIISSFTNKISDLEAKLEESEKQRQHLKDWLDNEILTSVDNESYYATINEYEEEVKKLKQQLDEKDKEIEQLKKFDDLNRHFFALFRTAFKEPDKVDDLFNTLKTTQEKHNQDKISFAVEQLEKVKNYMITYEKDMFGANYLMNSGYVLEFIDNQIKELKGEE